MPDDKSKTVADRKRINIHKDYELRFWSKKFGVSPTELRRAVCKVGTTDVGRELGILAVRDEPIGNIREVVSLPIAAASGSGL